MRKSIGVCLAMFAGAVCYGQGTSSINEITSDVAKKIGRISSFSATVETSEEAEDGKGPKKTAALQVSRLYGWKMVNSSGSEPFTAVTDFQTFYQYFPQERRVLKTVADNPEIKAMLTKPVTDMNPLRLLDQQSLIYHGTKQLSGETVYHVAGTTESQLMPGGPQVKRFLEAWVSVEDGLPRRTEESVGISTGTTVYRNVKVNPELKPDDFAFTPPEGVSVISTNEQMRRIEQQMQNTAERAPAP